MISHSRTTITERDISEVIKVMKTGMVYTGPYVEEFENRVSNYIGREYGFATTSGTLAIVLSLEVLGVKKNDEVIIPSYVCHNVLSAVLFRGARPVLADIDQDDFNIDHDDVEMKINKNTKAIIVPHMYGMPAHVDRFGETGIPIIEDCAQAIGAKFKNNNIGTFGDISVFSFHALKMITSGSGGMILTDNGEIYSKLRSCNDPNYNNGEFMKYFPLTDLQAVLGISQLEQLEGFITRRREIARIYNDELKSLDVDLPIAEDKKREPVFYRYCIKLNKQENIEKIIELYLKEGIVVRRLYKPLHQFEPFKDQYCEVSERVFSRVISIPIYPTLSESDIGKIIDVTKKVLE